MTTVKLIAHTMIHRQALREIGYEVHADPQTDVDELHEFAGRNCYLSFGRPNPDTATNAGYLNHIHEVGHESIEEHGSVSFYINASRSVLTELERHRHLSFSVVSQRYVDASKLGVHVPPAFMDVLTSEQITDDDAAFLAAGVAGHLDAAQRVYMKVVEILQKAGKPRKQAREAARAVIPNCIDSPMVVTGNIRAWKHVLRMRWHEAADAEIRELAGLILQELRRVAPHSVADIPDEPFSY